MRRLLVILLLLALMYVLSYLQVESESRVNPESLAALGFILLAAFTFGEMASSIRLPRISGYIAAGVLFGPYAVDLFSLGVVRDLSLINALAIGLIALTAGGELRIPGLRRVGRILSLILLVKCGLILAAVTLAVWFGRPFLPFLAQASTPLVLSVGLLFGVLALGTSPAVTVAVINETRSRGRLSDLLLGAAVAKDLLMVILLALAVSLVKLFSTPGAMFDPGVLTAVSQELLASVLAGSVLGIATILYIRWVHAEMWLFVVGLVFVATNVADLLHLEALMMFIVAGFVVQNLSPYGDKFIEPIENLSLPVYVVFFSIAGAGLDLAALRAVGIIAASLFGVRLLAIYAGTRLATTLADEPLKIRENAWMGFVPQAGVVLGLSIIVAENLQLGPQIQLIVLASLALNLAVGPVTLKWALSRAGETFSDQPVAETEKPPIGAPTRVGRKDAVLEVRLRKPEFESSELNRAASDIRDKLIALELEFFASLLVPQSSEAADAVHRFGKTFGDEIERVRRQLHQTDQLPPIELERLLSSARARLARELGGQIISVTASDHRSERGRDLFTQLIDVVQSISEGTRLKIEVVQEAARMHSLPADARYARVLKWFKRFASGTKRFLAGRDLSRVVPVRSIVKFQLAGRFPVLLPGTANLVAAGTYLSIRKLQQLFERFDRELYSLVDRAARQEADPVSSRESLKAMSASLEQGLTEIAVDLEGAQQDIRRCLDDAFVRVYDGLIEQLTLAGTFELRPRKYRFSSVFRESREARQEIVAAFKRWRQFERGLAGLFARHLEVIGLCAQVRQVVDDRMTIPFKESVERVATHSRKVRSEVGRALNEIRKGPPSRRGARLEALQAGIRTALEKAITEAVAVRESNEIVDMLDGVLAEFEHIADNVAPAYVVIASKDLARAALDGATPPDIQLRNSPVRELARTHLEVKIARRLAEFDRKILQVLGAQAHSLSDVRQAVAFTWKTVAHRPSPLKGEELRHACEVLEGCLERSLSQLEGAEVKLEEGLRTGLAEIPLHLEKELKDLEERISESSVAELKVILTRDWLLRRGLDSILEVVEGVRRKVETLVRRYSPLGREVVKDLKTTFGLSRYSPAEIVGFYDAARPERLSSAALPFIYQRLFDVAPLESDEFLIARTEELELVATARDRWQLGMPCSVAVIGELGGGKTSFLNVAVGTVLKEYRCSRINFDCTLDREDEICRRIGDLFGFAQASTMEEIRLEIEGMPDRQVVILEDIHKLFLRTLGGFDGLRKLLLLIARTSQKVFWVVSLRNSTWRYLDRVLGLADYFTFVINMENLTRDEIRDVVLTRHKVSGFELEFLPDQYIQERKKYRKADPVERQRMVEEEYFRRLSRSSEGNVLAAIFAWLLSIEGVQGNLMRVKPFQPLNFDFLREMNVEKLLTLGMVVQHGTLSPSEHSTIFGIEEDSSLATLTYLANINLLIRTEAEPETAGTTANFVVNKILYKALARELRERNILH